MTDKPLITIRKPARYQNKDEKRQSSEEHKEFLAGKTKVWGMTFEEIKIFAYQWNKHPQMVQDLFYKSSM